MNLNQISSRAHNHKIEESIIRALLSEEALNQFRLGDVSHRILAPFADEIRLLSKDYNDLAAPAPGSITLQAAAAFSLYYLPINYAKISRLLRELPNFPGDKAIRVLDFGCGPGTATLALSDYVSNPAEICCVDQSEAMLATAMKIARQHLESEKGKNLSFSTKLPGREGGLYDLIFAVNVLCEVGPEAMRERAKELADLLAPAGVLLVLEPGLKDTTRHLMALRNELIAEMPQLVPIFPCTHAEPCPMLRESDRDWCHGTVHWNAPRLVRQMDELLGFNKHRIKFSSVIFQHGGKSAGALRVLTDYEKTKAGGEVLICGGCAYGRVVLPKSARSESNQEFRRLKQYDLVEISGIDESLRCTQNTVVTRISSIPDPSLSFA